MKMRYDGHKFAGKRECARYKELKLLEKAGEIENLELRPDYPIWINGKKVCTYKADFRYTQMEKWGPLGIGDWVVEDAKTYKLKVKLVEAVYGIVVKDF